MIILILLIAAACGGIRYYQNHIKQRSFCADGEGWSAEASGSVAVISLDENSEGNGSISIIGGADGPTSIFVAGKIGNPPDAVKTEETGTSWEQAVSEAVLTENRGKYTGEEFCGEGHLILGQKEEGDRMVIYALTMYGEYQFQNGNFVKEAGTGVIPAVLTFRENEDGSRILESFEVPEDGSGYLDSVHRLFPEELWENCISPSEQNRLFLREQEQNGARAYLETLGRVASVGEYADFEYRLLTEEGVSVEVSNRLICDRELSRYPGWVGSLERLEENVRYLYQVEVDRENGIIRYKKTSMDSAVTVESREFDLETGDPVR